MKVRLSERVPLLVLLVALFGLLSTSQLAAAALPAAQVSPNSLLSPTTLPPIPAGLPSYFSLGLSNYDGSWLTGSGVGWNLRYQYLTGGVNTGDGWATWTNPPGQFAASYLAESRLLNVIPAFVYYQILQSAPNYDEYQNLNHPSTMRSYFDDWKLLMQKCAQYGSPVFVNIEPDLTGMMMLHSSNTADDAARQPSSVASSGHPDVQAYANNFRGVYQAMAHIRDLYAPNVSLGLDISTWGAGDDIGTNHDPSFDWQQHAMRTATYLNSLGPGFQLLFFSPLDRDAAYYTSLGSNRWWDDNNVTLPNFDRMAAWMGTIITQTQKRALMWQVPNGNRIYRTENNTDGHYQDNRAEYFLNPTTGRTHMQQWAAYGFVGMMFGAGAGGQSHYFDSRGDGITNPPAVNGNNTISTLPDDDGGYLRLRSAAYYAGGPVGLPGGAPVPTATSTRTPLPTQTPGGPTATPTLCAMTFSDVQESDYFYQAANYLYCRGAISGYSDNTFRPSNATTRGQLSKIVVLAEGMNINTAGGPHFRDVSTGNAFYGYVETAYNSGIISGYSDGTFKPNANITRGQLCKVIVQAEGWTANTAGGPHFSDVSTGNAFYQYVETAYNRGVISGYGDNTFRPMTNATRGQISKIVYNAVTTP